MIGSTLVKPKDDTENNQEAFKRDITERLIPLSRVTLNNKQANAETSFPSSVTESYLINVTSTIQAFLISALKEEDYMLKDPEAWFHYHVDTDDNVDLTIELANLNLIKFQKSGHVNTYFIPGRISFKLKKIDNNTYQVSEIHASNDAAKALCSGKHDLDPESDAFKTEVLKATLNEAIISLEKTLDSKKDSDEKNQRILHECARRVLYDVKQADPIMPFDLKLYTETIEATHNFLIDPKNENIQNRFNDHWMTLIAIDNRRTKLVAGSMLVMFGSAVFVGAVITVGPAGVGLFGAAIAAKALKAFVLKHLIVSTLAASATALGTEEWFRARLFKSTKEALCDDMAVLRKSSTLSNA